MLGWFGRLFSEKSEKELIDWPFLEYGNILWKQEHYSVG